MAAGGGPALNDVIGGQIEMTFVGALASMPPALVGRLHGELVKVVALRDIRERFVALGLEALGSTPDYLADYIRNDLVKWSKLVQSIGLKTD